jgi:transcriptional regulator of acetoin/glycerol metabolism
MPYVSQTRHIDRVRNVIEGRMSSPGADGSRLASSYRRSLEQYHLDPGATIGPRILTVPELRDVQQREETVLRASGQCLSRLHETVREADYCVMLTDAEGVTIDYRVDRDRRHEFKRAGLYPGSCWSEREEGTCGVASVLLDAEAITVHKTDHFRAAFTTLTCSASPIFGVQGELIGVLDASAVRSPEERESQRLVNHIVRQSALLIEDGFFLNATTHCWSCLRIAAGITLRHSRKYSSPSMHAVTRSRPTGARRNVCRGWISYRATSPNSSISVPNACSMHAPGAISFRSG